MNVVRAMDRFYEKHPNISFAIAVLCAFAFMYIARDWDKSESSVLRLQMMSVSRSAT